jgi:hypothetical protein
MVSGFVGRAVGTAVQSLKRWTGQGCACLSQGASGFLDYGLERRHERSAYIISLSQPFKVEVR